MKTQKLHVHLENLSSKHPVFRLTSALAAAARRRNPDVAKRARFTVGEDFAGFDGRLRSADVLVTSSDVIRHPSFPKASLRDAAPKLRQIHLIGAGVEGVLPLDWLPRGVRLTNNSGVHAGKAQESAAMMLLALNGRLPAIATNQRERRWDQIFTPRIHGKTLLVAGLGKLGQAAVRAARSLGMTVTGVSRSGKKVPGVARVYRPGQLAQAVKSVDFIFVAAPLTPETRNLFSRAVLSATKPGVGIANMGRAGVMDYDALAELLRDGHVSGAILDVFSPEPLPDSSPLWTTPNLLIVPHVSSDDAEAYMHDTMDLVCRNLRQMSRGRPLDNVVDPARGY